MRVSFFEEYPTDENLAKLDLVDPKSNLFLGAKSLDDFMRLKKDIKKRKVVYWPLLDVSDGYWISPFTTRRSLEELFAELRNSKIPIMLDMELPSRNRWLFLTQLFNACTNNHSINDFLEDYEGEVYTAEYLFELPFLSFMYKDPRRFDSKVIKMVYSSMHDYSEDFLRGKLKGFVERYGDRFVAGLGTIATGVLGDEPKLSPSQLDRDLRICRDVGVEEVVIFRLGGLDADYLKVIKKYI